MVHAKFDDLCSINEHTKTCAERLNDVFVLLFAVFCLWIIGFLHGYLDSSLDFLSQKCDIVQCLAHMLNMFSNNCESS